MKETVLKKNNWQVPCFYICVLLFYPVVWIRLFTGRVPYWNELRFFTPGLIALLCCALLLFNAKALFSFFSRRAARMAGMAFGFILLVAFIQLITCYDGRINYLWSSVYWIAIPLFCAVNRREVEKYLPFFMILLGLATVIQSFHGIRLDNQCYGIPGNWNWNASLLAVTLPFICLGIYRCFHKYDKFSPWLITFFVLGVVALILYCESKAAVLALITACGSVAVLRYWRKMSRVYWLRTGILLAICAMILLQIFKEQLFVILREDQRFLLWSGALDLIKENLWFGCGPGLFESAYAHHIPADYYFGRLVSIRHPHAHNHLLQFAATMGIPALLAWCSVIVYFVIKNLRQAAGPGNWYLKLYLFIFILLLTHSMFDNVVLSWPLGCIFLIIFGILLGRAVEGAEQKKIKPHKPTLILNCIAAACCAIALLNYLSLNLLSSRHYRNARLMLDKGNIKSAFTETVQSIAYKANPQNTYLAAKIYLYDFKNPRKCLEYLDLLAALGFENYEHNNLLRAKALAAGGKLSEALLYFAQEQQNFPLSCVNLYYYHLILNKLGKKQQAKAIDKYLKYLLKLKGFTKDTLPVLLKDPSKDLRFKTMVK